MNALLEQISDKQKVKPQRQLVMESYLGMLQEKDQGTYRHSVRVASLTAAIVARCGIEELDPAVMLWAALLHDVGKLFLNPRLLTDITYTEADYLEMQLHAEYGWRVFRRIDAYMANIIVRHHRFGPRPYPAELPPLPASLASQGKIIEVSARLLALADYYDAITHRNDGKFGKKLTPAEQREKYLQGNADQKDLVLALEREGVFQFVA